MDRFECIEALGFVDCIESLEINDSLEDECMDAFPSVLYNSSPLAILHPLSLEASDDMFDPAYMDASLSVL